MYAHPDSGRLGTVPGPCIMRAKDHCLKIPNLPSQKTSKDLCNGSVKCQTIESAGRQISLCALAGSQLVLSEHWRWSLQ